MALLTAQHTICLKCNAYITLKNGSIQEYKKCTCKKNNLSNKDNNLIIAADKLCNINDNIEEAITEANQLTDQYKDMPENVEISLDEHNLLAEIEEFKDIISEIYIILEDDEVITNSSPVFEYTKYHKRLKRLKFIQDKLDSYSNELIIMEVTTLGDISEVISILEEAHKFLMKQLLTLRPKYANKSL